MATVRARTCAARSRDGCVVDTPPLSRLIRSYVTAYDANHPSPALVDRTGRVNGGGRSPRGPGGRFAGGGRGVPPSAIEALHARTAEIAARHPGLHAIPPATIRKVMKGTYRTTELRIADMLVTALERTEAFYDGTLTIKPNPNADARARASCCGSLTGSGH